MKADFSMLRLIGVLLFVLLISACGDQRAQQSVEDNNGQDSIAAKSDDNKNMDSSNKAKSLAAVDAVNSKTEEPVVYKNIFSLKTNVGDIVMQLNIEKAPKTVANIKRYALEGFYDGTVFHRVMDNFMIQGGGFAIDKESKSFVQKKTHPAIHNEGNNGLKNLTGTVAMARTNHPHSATAQFYINLVDNTHLNATATRPGYCVFGKVIEGMDVVRKIAKVQTSRTWPVDPIIIIKASYE